MQLTSEPDLFVVTGGSRGIGAAIACLAARHYHVVILYRSGAAEAQHVVERIQAGGGRANAIQTDVGDEAAVLNAYKQIDELGSIQVLVNNAAITGSVSRVDTVSYATVSDVFRVNVIGAFVAAREAVKRMSTAHGGKGGAIVNISSGAAQLGSANNWVHYAATKGAMDTMTIGLAKEVASEGIRVNAVRPGLVATDIQNKRSAEQLARMVMTIPMGRMGEAEEIAETVLWLASPAASYVTGAILDARGGL
ncbi:SDR family oxidoreductase [Allopusillimonas ginsengisoli]|nr:SDR family oxidoreductase [Allopusillimonas ginsengisoli]